jgi:hypothetical protein
LVQKKEETIGSEVVNVSSHAYHRWMLQNSDIAVLDDEGPLERDDQIFDFFSGCFTFTPLREKLRQINKTSAYTNYATLDLQLSNVKRRAFRCRIETVMVVKFRHLSSQGGISGVEPDDRYYDTGIDRPAGTHPMQLEC